MYQPREQFRTSYIDVEQVGPKKDEGKLSTYLNSRGTQGTKHWVLSDLQLQNPCVLNVYFT